LQGAQVTLQNLDLASALERAADTADAQAEAQHHAAELARAAAREERAGLSDAAGEPRVRLVLDILARNAERMADVVGHLRRAWAATLTAQGLSARQVAARLGVSHQRVSVLLRNHDRTASSSER
jgi:hypothetical protein